MFTAKKTSAKKLLCYAQQTFACTYGIKCCSLTPDTHVRCKTKKLR